MPSYPINLLCDSHRKMATKLTGAYLHVVDSHTAEASSTPFESGWESKMLNLIFQPASFQKLTAIPWRVADLLPAARR
jgi:hypothetical protein